MGNTNYSVNTTSLRYALPFKYDNNFNAACKLVDKHDFIRELFDNEDTDLYEYIRDEFYFEDNDNISCLKMGYRWSLPEIKIDLLIRDAHRVQLHNVGLFLFRNNIGIIYYDLGIENNITSSELVFIQRYAKELCTLETYKKDGEPYILGKYFNNLLSFLNIQWFVEKKTKDDLTLVPYFPILFTYACFEDKDDNENDKYALSYHLTNGYDETYHYNKDNNFQTVKPFDNVIWNASSNGVSNISFTTDDNREFFSGRMVTRFNGDYFTLFIKTIFQSYSLLHYSEKIQKIMSCDIEDTPSKDVSDLYAEINLFLSKCTATSVSYTDHQSSFYCYLKKEFRIQEDIDCILSGLSILDSIKKEQDLNREKESDNRANAIMSIFALLGVFSALVDAFDFIAKFSKGGEWSGLGYYVGISERIGISIIALLTLPAVYIAFKSLNVFSKNEKLVRWYVIIAVIIIIFINFIL